MNVSSAVARLAIGVPFVIMGAQGAYQPGIRTKLATNFGIPDEFADLAVRANGAALALGGLAVATGILPRAGALLAAGAMVPSTLAGHSFWKDADPAARKQNQIQFLKNLGMVGGLLLVAATGAGPGADG